MLRPLLRALRLGKSRYIAGEDLAGNTYYEYPSLRTDHAARTRRVVEYREKKKSIVEYDAGELPVQWKMWLRHTRKGAPSLEELEADRQRIIQLQHNVKLIQQRDDEARARMEQARLEVLPGPAVAAEVAEAAAVEPQSEPRSEPQPEQPIRPAAPATPPRRSRRAAAPVPTEIVSETGNVVEQRSRTAPRSQQQRTERVPVSVPSASTGAGTSTSTSTSTIVEEERTADDDVWKASRERIRAQDRAQQARRGYHTMVVGRGRGPPQRHSSVILGMLRAHAHYSTSSSSSPSTPPPPPPRRPNSPLYRPPPAAPTRTSSATPSPGLLSKIGTTLGHYRYDPGKNSSDRGAPYAWIATGFASCVGVAFLWAQGDPPVLGGISPNNWVKCEVAANRLAVSPSSSSSSSSDDDDNAAATRGDGKHALLTLTLPRPAPENILLTAGKADLHVPLAIYSLSLAQPEMNIERSYTPLQYPALAAFRGEVQLLVKRYEDGEMGSWLHALRPSSSSSSSPHKGNAKPRNAKADTVPVRGWLKTWDESFLPSPATATATGSTTATEPPRPVEEIVFIAGGTGIAPAYQLITSALAREIAHSQSEAESGSASENGSADSHRDRPHPRFHILYAAPSRASVCLLPELEALQRAFPQEVRVDVFCEEGGSTSSSSGGLGLGLGMGGGEAGITGKVKGLFGLASGSGTGSGGEVTEGDAQTEGVTIHKGRITPAALRSALARPPVPAEASGAASVAATTASAGDAPAPSSSPPPQQHPRRAILICGPDGLVEAIAGSGRVWDAKRQVERREASGARTLGGYLKGVEGVSGEEVWRL